MPTISFKDVSYIYVNGDETFPALENVNLDIEDGEFVCLVGHSGCGKSTMLNIIAGLAKPTQGEVLIDGRPIEGPGPDRAIVFQNYSLFPWQTALKNVMFAIRQTNKGVSRERAKARALALLGQVEMEDAAGRYPFQLSGGMRQRVAIARALAVDAPILLLDEPFGALDPLIRHKLQELLMELWNGGEGRRKTTVFVTHDIDEALFLADRIVFMEPKHVIETLVLPRGRSRKLTEFDSDPAIKEAKQKVLRLFDRTATGKERER